jgi:hypothetical protein
VLFKISENEMNELIASRMSIISRRTSQQKNIISRNQQNSLRPIRWMKTQWSSDPNSLGAYSYVPKGINTTGTCYPVAVR